MMPVILSSKAWPKYLPGIWILCCVPKRQRSAFISVHIYLLDCATTRVDLLLRLWLSYNPAVSPNGLLGYCNQDAVEIPVVDVCITGSSRTAQRSSRWPSLARSTKSTKI